MPAAISPRCISEARLEITFLSETSCPARRPADNKQQTASTRKETADPPGPRRFDSQNSRFALPSLETLNLKVGMRSADNKQQTAWGHAALLHVPACSFLEKAKNTGLSRLGEPAAERGPRAERVAETAGAGRQRGWRQGLRARGLTRAPGLRARGLNCTNFDI